MHDIDFPDPHLIVVEKGVSEAVAPGTRHTKTGGMVVRRLSRGRERVPGGNETIEDGVAEGYQGRPVLKIRHVRLIVDTDLDAPDLDIKVARAAEELQLKFRKVSHLSLDQTRIVRPRTLVTVIRYPIHVRPKGTDMSAPAIRQMLADKPEFFQGFEARCSFVQVVRRGSVDPQGFEVRSWTGQMPIKLPQPRDVRRIVDMFHHIQGAQAAMDRFEQGEIIHR